MSGHSKWSQIKHKKALADSKKGKAFGKLAQAISMAARANPDPAKNLRLKGEIERARAVNMPNESIQRAIRRVSEKDASALVDIQLEFIGPENSAIIVSAITDNSNRTIGDLKKIAASFGVHMVGRGAVLWMFQKIDGEFVPFTPLDITDSTAREHLESFLEALDDHDDVQELATNVNRS